MISIVIGVLGLTVAALSGVLSTIDATGIVDESIERWRFVTALAGALLTALGTKGVLGTFRGTIPGVWQALLPIIAGLVAIVPALWLLFDHPNQEYSQGEIDAETPFAKRTLLTGGNGSRYFITLDTTPGLTATFSIRGAGQEITGIASDGRVVAEGVLAGDATWTVVIKPLEGSGKYLLYVDSVDPNNLRLDGAAHTHSFDPGRARSSFVFDVEPASGELAQVFVQARAVLADEPDPGWTLRSSSGTTIDHKVVEDRNNPLTTDQSTIAEVPAGEYVLDVFGTVGQRFALTVDDRAPANALPTPSPTPGPVPTQQPDSTQGPQPPVGYVSVPAEVQYQAPGSEVVTALAAAGFVAQNVPVCSNSFAAADIPVGATRQVVKAGAATIADEVEILGANGLNSANLQEGNSLPVGTRLEVKTFNGLPCQ